MSASGDFLLTRPDHQSSLACSIKEETEFHDVILACQDQQVGAHKVVLAASSPKLRNILLRNPHSNPLIYLSGVQFSILENILKFIYQGEVVINRDQVRSFLDVAQELQVKGLIPPPLGGHQTGEEVSSNRKDSSLGREERSGVKMRKPTATAMEEVEEVIEDTREDQETQTLL